LIFDWLYIHASALGTPSSGMKPHENTEEQLLNTLNVNTIAPDNIIRKLYHVRQLFGYYRFQNPDLVLLMNDLYHNELSLLHNYFYPAMKLQDKIRIQSKIKKHYDKPQTPYQRLIASEHVNVLQKEKMHKIFESLNPFELQQIIQRKLRNIFKNIDLNLRGRSTGT